MLEAFAVDIDVGKGAQNQEGGRSTRPTRELMKKISSKTFDVDELSEEEIEMLASEEEERLNRLIENKVIDFPLCALALMLCLIAAPDSRNEARFQEECQAF